MERIAERKRIKKGDDVMDSLISVDSDVRSSLRRGQCALEQLDELKKRFDKEMEAVDTKYKNFAIMV